MSRSLASELPPTHHQPATFSQKLLTPRSPRGNVVQRRKTTGARAARTTVFSAQNRVAFPAFSETQSRRWNTVEHLGEPTGRGNIGGRRGVRKGPGPWRFLGNVTDSREKWVLAFQQKIHSQIPRSPRSGTP